MAVGLQPILESSGRVAAHALQLRGPFILVRVALGAKTFQGRREFRAQRRAPFADAAFPLRSHLGAEALDGRKSVRVQLMQQPLRGVVKFLRALAPRACGTGGELCGLAFGYVVQQLAERSSRSLGRAIED